jgi:hypothetical protein
MRHSSRRRETRQSARIGVAEAPLIVLRGSVRCLPRARNLCPGKSSASARGALPWGGSTRPPRKRRTLRRNGISRADVVARPQIVGRSIHGEPIERDELGPGGFDCKTSAHSGYVLGGRHGPSGCTHVPASALAATQPLHESRDWCVWRDRSSRKRLPRQCPDVLATQTFDNHGRFNTQRLFRHASHIGMPRPITSETAAAELGLGVSVNRAAKFLASVLAAS